MKKIFTLLTIAFLAAGCTIDKRAHFPEDRVTDLKILVTPGEVQNTYLLRTNRTDVIAFWDLGNNTTASGVNSVLAKYPFAGDYTVVLNAYGNNGKTNTVSINLSVTGENLYLLDDPMYIYVAGEIGGEGKTWIMDAERDYHIDLLNPNDPTQSWWHVNALGKAGAELYDDEITFYLNTERGQGLDYENHGKSCALSNATAASELFKDPAWCATSDVLATTNDHIISCTPPAGMGWVLKKSGSRYYIEFPNTANGHGGYLFYFCGWNTKYEIAAISETHMKVLMWSNLAGSNSLRAILLRTKDTPASDEPIEWDWTNE